MSSLAGVKVGDTLILVGMNRRGETRVAVDAVGRKYVTVGRDKYKIENGQVADAWGHDTLHTEIAWRRICLEAEARRAVQNANDALARHRSKLNDDDLRTLIAACEATTREAAVDRDA